jgi:hypothetical protein
MPKTKSFILLAASQSTGGRPCLSKQHLGQQAHRPNGAVSFVMKNAPGRGQEMPGGEGAVLGDEKGALRGATSSSDGLCERVLKSRDQRPVLKEPVALATWEMRGCIEGRSCLMTGG